MSASDVLAIGKPWTALRRAAAILLAAIALVVAPVDARRHYSPPATATTSSTTLAQFVTEASAQAHCPRETVVWLNTRPGSIMSAGCAGTAGRAWARTCAALRPTRPAIVMRGTGGKI